MTVFWINLTVVFIFSILARYTGKPVPSGINKFKPNKGFTFIAISSLVLVSGLRSGIGDTYFYKHSYTLMGTDLNRALSSTDFGFNILIVLLNYISRDPQILVFVTALITNTLIFKVVYNYADPFELGTFLYITTGSYLVSMNGIRQFFASAIVFAAIKWLNEGKWVKYLLVVLVASTIHLTALIMIPVYFIVRQKAWSKTTIIILGFTLTIFVFFRPFISGLFEVMGDNQYAHYKDYLSEAGHGANAMRSVIAAVPLALAYLGRKKLREFWPKSDYIVNMSLINIIFMLFSLYNWLFARFTVYFGLYNLILLPWTIKYAISNRNTKIMYFLLVLCYLIFYYFENVISLGMKYNSNYFKI